MLFATGILEAQTPANPYHQFSRKELSEVKSKYEDISKEYRDVQKSRQQLENAIKNYDNKLKRYSEHMEETEQRVDNGLGAYSADPKYLLATRQVSAANMSYNLQSTTLLSNITSQQLQLNAAAGNLTDKYTMLMKMKGKP